MLVNTIIQPDYFKSTFQKCHYCWELHKRAVLKSNIVATMSRNTARYPHPRN